MYGERNTWEDARVTVTEFLDDFQDDSADNFNQALLNLERRLQEYFQYEPRDTENGDTGSDGAAAGEARPFVVYNDGAVWARFADEKDAANMVALYDGDHDVWYERDGDEGDPIPGEGT